MKIRTCRKLSGNGLVAFVSLVTILGYLCVVAHAGQSSLNAALLVASHSSSKVRTDTKSSSQEKEDNKTLNLNNLTEKSSTPTLSILPQEVTLFGSGASQQLVVSFVLGKGRRQDVTSRSHFSSSNPKVVEVNELGRMTAGAIGEAILKAEFDGQSIQIKTRVVKVEPPLLPTFRRDVVRILTKHGCNNTECHGAVKGRGGYKLSLSGLVPEEDYEWTIRGGAYQVLVMEAAGERVPRINLDEPEKSLLLKKPVLSVPHGGEKLFEVDSDDYQTILSWIRRGAPYGAEAPQTEIERIKVFPIEVVLDQDEEQQLLVTGYFTGEIQKDFTDQVHYISNNVDVAEVTPEGVVLAIDKGETDIIIFAPGHFASVRLGVVADRIENHPDPVSQNFIDNFVFGKLKRFEILPSELSSDEEFLRRVCLDVAGTLPPSERVRKFLASQDPHKRTKLIEALLDSPEYIDYWTFRFSDLFRVALYAQFIAKNTHDYWDWIYTSIAAGKPYDQIARERISAQGLIGSASHYVPGEYLPQDNMAEQVRVFMGRRLDCAQCHNHPYQAWRQDQFWGLTAFFGNVARVGYLEGLLTDIPGGGFGKGGSKGPGSPTMHPRRHQVVQPSFFDGTLLNEIQQRDPRNALAKWMTSHPYFAEASVNRIWSYFFGRGIVDPVDDFRATNPPTHPKLLKNLARHFQEKDYNLRELIRIIVTSRTYQLSSTPNKNNKEDRINYSHQRPRRLEAELLLDAISNVTRVPEIFSRSSHGTGTDPSGTRAISLKENDVYASRFLDIHGRPDRLMVPERNNSPTLSQALHRLAGRTYIGKLSKAGGIVDQFVKKNALNQEIIEELCLAALSRFPTEKEMDQLEVKLNQSVDRRKAIEDLVWGLLSTSEFVYNH